MPASTKGASDFSRPGAHLLAMATTDTLDVPEKMTEALGQSTTGTENPGGSTL